MTTADLPAGVSGSRVLIVEDHELLAQSLAMALGAEGMDVRIVPLESLDGVVHVAEGFRPDVVLLDLDLGPLGSALPLVAPLTGAGAKVLLVTGSTELARIAETVEAGAVGYVQKSQPFDALLAAVLEVAALQTVLTPAQRTQLLGELRRQRREQEQRFASFERLTRREQEVLAALVDGKSADLIARESYVSVATVRSQIRAVLRKLDVSSQLAAVAVVNRAGWRPPDSPS